MYTHLPIPNSNGIVALNSYISDELLLCDTKRLMQRLPSDVEAVVGCSRSGLLPATVVAAHLHLPLYSVSKRTGVVDLGGGTRDLQVDAAAVRKLVLIDDTTCQGNQLPPLREITAAHFPNAEIVTAVVYNNPFSKANANLSAWLFPGNHFLEWNWPNSGIIDWSGLDFDGVLCRDCLHDENDDGAKYQRFLQTAEPLHLPRRHEVPLIVTARHERYRPLTELWLARHGVRCRKLVMRDFDVKSGWTAAVAKFKADHFAAAADLHLFVESDEQQARLIHEFTGKDALCPTTGAYFGNAINCDVGTKKPAE